MSISIFHNLPLFHYRVKYCTTKVTVQKSDKTQSNDFIKDEFK
jgi:hypothetical protein